MSVVGQRMVCVGGWTKDGFVSVVGQKMVSCRRLDEGWFRVRWLDKGWFRVGDWTKDGFAFGDWLSKRQFRKQTVFSLTDDENLQCFFFLHCNFLLFDDEDVMWSQLFLDLDLVLFEISVVFFLFMYVSICCVMFPKNQAIIYESLVIS